MKYLLGGAVLVGVDVTSRFDRGGIIDAEGNHAVIGAGTRDDGDPGTAEGEDRGVPLAG